MGTGFSTSAGPATLIRKSLRYVAAIAAVTLATLLRIALDPYLGNNQPYGTFYVVVSLVAWWAGWGPACVALVLGYVAGDWFFVPPRYSLGVDDPVHAMDLLMYLFVTGTVIALVISLRQTEAALKGSEQRFRVMAEAVPDLLFATDAEGMTDYVNRAFHEYTGLVPGHPQRLGWSNAVHPEDVANVQAHWTDSLREGRVFEAECRFRAPGGGYRWFVARALPIKDQEGRITRWVGCCTDIEAQKHQAELLKEKVAARTAELEHSVQELEGFSYSLMHDMRAPLRAMRGYADLVLADAGKAPEEQRLEYLRRITVAAERMDRLIVDSLNYSKVLRSKLPMGNVDLGELLRGIIDSYPNLQPPTAEIRIEFDRLVVRGNEAALTQCFSNLLGNAVKFVTPRTEPRVAVRAEEIPLEQNRGPGKAVRVWVEDNGIGIPPHGHQLIFDMFQRMHGAESYPGTGIGLAIVRKAVERMGGRVGVESEPGHGSRFWVELTAA